MERCSLHDNSCHLNRFEICDGSDGSRSTNRMFNREDFRSYLFCWEFIGYRVPRMVFCATKLIPESHIIELEYHTIDIKIKIILSILGFSLKYFRQFIDSSCPSKRKVLSFESPRRKKCHQILIFFNHKRLIKTLLNLRYTISKKLKFS